MCLQIKSKFFLFLEKYMIASLIFKNEHTVEYYFHIIGVWFHMLSTYAKKMCNFKCRCDTHQPTKNLYRTVRYYTVRN